MFRFARSLRRQGMALSTAAVVAASGGCASAISTQEEVQLGRQYASEINQQLPIVNDPAIQRYINELGGSIARVADPRGLDYTFQVVNSDVVNAFAIPGGFIYVNRGLIEQADNLSELAGVIGHEIGHVAARHGIEQMAEAQRANALVGVVYGVLLGRNPGTLEQVGLQVGGAAYFASHSRADENEADRLAVDYLVRAGINPEGIVTFFEELLRERESRPSQLEQWFSTHPLTEERIEATRRAVQAIPASRRQSLTTNTETFEQFQARVQQLPAPPQDQ